MTIVNKYKINRNITIGIIICIIVIGICENLKSVQANGAQKLVEAFSNTSFQLIKSDLNIWGNYQTKYMTKEEMKEIVTDVAEELGINNYLEDYYEDENIKTYKLEKEGAYSNTVIKFVETIEQVEEDTYKPENYIIINIVLKDKCQSILYFEDIIKEYFKEIKVVPTTNLTVTGSIDGKISESDSKEIMTTILTSLEGEVKSSFYDEQISSIYGYTKHVEDFIISDGEKINMDLAITYNEIEDKTYLYGAIPVITVEY